MQPAAGYLRAVRLVRDRVSDFKVYPFSIPSIQSLDELELHPKVTFLIGENGAGKSTLIEAIAILMGFNAEGGTKNFRFDTRRSESSDWGSATVTAACRFTSSPTENCSLPSLCIGSEEKASTSSMSPKQRCRRNANFRCCPSSTISSKNAPLSLSSPRTHRSSWLTRRP